MTKCLAFYEKLDRDGNDFCGLPSRFFREAMEYWNDYRKAAEEAGVKSPLSEAAWFKQKRGEALTKNGEISPKVGGEESKNVLGILNPDYQREVVEPVIEPSEIYDPISEATDILGKDKYERILNMFNGVIEICRNKGLEKAHIEVMFVVAEEKVFNRKVKK